MNQIFSCFATLPAWCSVASDPIPLEVTLAEKTPLVRVKTYDPRPWVKVCKALAPDQEVPKGPWDDEPDEVFWRDDVTRLYCVAIRREYGTWCGYVNVPKGHPTFGTHHNDLEDIDVHGGLTFSGSLLEEGDWWLGFDTGHAFDRGPVMELYYAMFRVGRDDDPWPDVLGMPMSSYRDLNYVKHEINNLALELMLICVGANQ